jgi:type II protein arginine methyltransferase
VQHLLNSVHGISIPASYTAHVTPIAAPKLYGDITHGMIPANPDAAETPYVVMLNAIDHLSTEVVDIGDTATSPVTAHSNIHDREAQAPSQPTPIIHQAWGFHHSNPALPAIVPCSIGPQATTEPSLSNRHNARVCTLTFPIPNRGTCHGLAGYFETVLYKGVELSTNPNTMDQKSEGMISWFPIYFPLKVSPHTRTRLC